jgi:hypothetical protein
MTILGSRRRSAENARIGAAFADPLVRFARCSISARGSSTVCRPVADGSRLLVVVAVDVEPRTREGGLVAL